MNPVVVVPRTCTEVPADTPYRATREAREPRPLSEFRSRPAYVLLGDPGSGKTTAFEQESRAMGEAAMMLSARDFITFDVDSHPDWHGKTLFIDGLDEMRAGAVDPRSPLDQIRGKLDRLGKPSFRLSCREADWLGMNDPQKLDSVSPDGQISVLRLDPLSNHATSELLRARTLGGDASEFVAEAQQRGVAAMLDNPLTLELLADAVAQGGEWPQSRQETFELACQKMATEWNDEHRAGAAITDTAAVLDAAGWLCAQALLAGAEGYSLALEEDDASFVALETLADPPSQVSRDTLIPAVASALFAAVGNQRFRPRHRHIAEFLGGRHLAQLVNEGRPARRVVTLIAGASDGRVVTPLRGLSAWLAAYSGEARRLLGDADPVGIGLYGDIGTYTSGEKQRLLRSLAAFAAEAPLFGHQHSDRRHAQYRDDTAWAFRHLATSDMAEPITDLLHNLENGSDGDRVMEFVLRVLLHTDTSERDWLIGLTETLEGILRNPDRSPRVKVSALDAYLYVAPQNERTTRTLMELLDAAHNGLMPDPDDELRGTLLTTLYPSPLTPSQVWQYALLRNQPNLTGRFRMFWEKTLLERSSSLHTAGLLDALHKDVSRLLPALDKTQFQDLPLRILACCLEENGDALDDLPRLHNWLSAVGRSEGASRNGVELPHRIRSWLEDRSQVQKEVFLAWLRQRGQSDDYLGADRIPYALHRSKFPADFGLWCLNQAMELANSEQSISEELLGQAYDSLQTPSTSEGLTLEIMQDRTREHPALAQRLNKLNESPSPQEESDRFRRQRRERMAEYEAQERRRRQEWVTLLREHQADLRENRLDAPTLDVLAKVYFDLYVGLDSDSTPEDRIRDFVGGNQDLTEAVLIGLREAVTRDDLPDSDLTIALQSESKMPWLAYPVRASLELLNREDPMRLDRISADQKRSALAIYYCFPLERESRPFWCRRWLEQDLDLVLDILFQCATAAIRAGEDFGRGFSELDSVDTRRDLRHEFQLRLLKAFPTRARQAQLATLDQMLTAAASHPDKAPLKQLIEKKLALKSLTPSQRVRWLAADVLLTGGQRLEALVEYLDGNERRLRALAEFFERSKILWLGQTLLSEDLAPRTLGTLVRMLGTSYGPLQVDGLVRLEHSTSDNIGHLIRLLSTMAGQSATQEMDSLIADPSLDRWHGYLLQNQEQQRVVHRDTSYRHPTIEEVRDTLSNSLPASQADLAALLDDRLRDVGEDMRGGSSNPWRQYWNEDSHRRLVEPKHEESCRDALLESLQARLPDEVDAVPEGRYATDKRADIRVSYGGFNVPVEIKKNSHLDLWSALRRQLIGQYTTDPATSGYGIYLVLWFGAERTMRHPEGNQPTTPDELRQRLEEELTSGEARKISVIVLDVTKPA